MMKKLCCLLLILAATPLGLANKLSYVDPFEPDSLNLANLQILDFGGGARIARRDGPERCSTGSPCADGSCCSAQNTCGYGPNYCGSGCTSNCNATAMCGQYSEGGQVSCGMNLCCSVYGWCGTDAAHCTVNPPGGGGCQQGFGSCQVYNYPSCDPNGGSTNGRTIAYYQGSNVYNRACQTVTPSQINTVGFTHLYFAFAAIDPVSFKITPFDQRDIPLYKEFTKLQRSGLETWIAVGGWSLSNAGPTFHTWSQMTSTVQNRAAFIASTIEFFQFYGFQGIDLDWEYPGAPGRGGNINDKANFVALVREMHQAYGGQYKISLTLAPDIGSLIGFNGTAMVPYVDWFGFMGYDLRGAWDVNDAVGNYVGGQTDARLIHNDTLALWFAQIPPSKVNFGMAYYGRGYTLSDPTCDWIGCQFTGPSVQADCTASPGVMSLTEIKQLIHAKGLVPDLLTDPMMKQIVFNSNQWIGYDDFETYQMKIQMANGLCFGGTMYWSIDFVVDTAINDQIVGGQTAGIWFN